MPNELKNKISTRLTYLDNDEIIASLDRELPEYLSATDGVSMSSEDEKLACWADNV